MYLGRSALLLAAGFAVLLLFTVSRAAPWPPVDPAELADPRPKLDPEAGAEILLAEVVMDETPVEAQWRHTIRARIFDERGVSRFAKIEIRHDPGTKIIDVAARTIRPDGSVLELDRAGIFARDIIRTQTGGTKVVSFAPPGLEQGVIVEYRYTEARGQKARVWPLRFQRDLPIRVSRFLLKPATLLTTLNIGLRSISFNCPAFTLAPDKQGFLRFETTDVPAWKDEPFQLPPLQLQRSAVIYYTVNNPGNPETFWNMEAARIDQRREQTTKPDKLVKAEVAKIVSGADDPAEKLRKLHDHVRTNLVNRDRDTNRYTPEQRRKLKPNANASDTLKSGNGTSDDLVIAFVALARAGGFDARLAMANDRSLMIYQPGMMEPFLFIKLIAAVRTGDGWTFFDPGATYLPANLVDWKYTGTAALIGDPKKAVFAHVEIPAAAASLSHRTGNFTLDEEGTLEGVLTEVKTGYPGYAVKHSLDALSPAERTKAFTAGVQALFPLAEVSEVEIKNVESPIESAQVTFRMRVPQYAERTGSRLFFQPGVMKKNSRPLFESPTRRGAVLFQHLYSELDDIEIAIPAGYALEAANSPGSLDLADRGRYQTKITFNTRTRVVRYFREFAWEMAGISPGSYSAMKNVFDFVHQQDSHVLTLKRAEAAKE